MSAAASRWLRGLYGIASLVLIMAALYVARSVLIPVVLAVLLTFLLTPLVRMLQRFRIPRAPATLLVMLAALLVSGGVGVLVAHQVGSLLRDLPNHRQAILAKIDEVREQGRESWLAEFSDTINAVSQRLSEEDPAEAAGERPAPVRIVPSHLSILQVAAMPLLDFLIMTGLVLILTFFMLLRREDLRNRLIRLWGHRQLIVATKAFDDAGQRIGQFLISQLAINVAYGAAFGVGLYLLDVPYPLLGGVVAAVLRYVPYIGVWLAAVGPVAVSVAVLPGWWVAVVILVYVLILDLSFDYLVEPFVYGHSIGVSEVSLLIALAFWGWLWGLPGMILATPLTACLAVLGRHLPRLGFLNVVLGDQPALEPHYAFYQRLVARDHDEALEVVNTYAKEHSGQAVSEDLLVPALVLARAHRDRGELTLEEEQSVYRQIRELPPGLGGLSATVAETERNGSTTPLFDDEDRVSVLGCPGGEEAHEIALEMFSRALPRRLIRLEIAPASLLAGELIARIRDQDPSILLLAALPPDGATQVRYLVKRLRTEFPDKKIVVAVWGLRRHYRRVRDHLLRAGADLVGTTMAESRAQLTALLPVAEGTGTPS